MVLRNRIVLICASFAALTACNAAREQVLPVLHNTETSTRRVNEAGILESSIKLKNTGRQGSVVVIAIECTKEGEVLKHWEKSVFFDENEEKIVTVPMPGMNFDHFVAMDGVAAEVWSGASQQTRDDRIQGAVKHAIEVGEAAAGIAR